MTKTYRFRDDGWWDSSGCSCCEPAYMECWNSDDIHHSCYDKGDCYASVLEDLISTLSTTQIQEILETLKVRVEFEDGD